MRNIILQIKSDPLNVVSDKTEWTQNSFWFWLFLIEFLIIILLLIKINRNKSSLTFSDLNKETIRKAKDQNINMDNLMDSINSSTDLYKELSSKCHPDRFVNSDKQLLAEKIFQEISKDKRNYEKLCVLKERAITELNISFDEKNK